MTRACSLYPILFQASFLVCYIWPVKAVDLVAFCTHSDSWMFSQPFFLPSLGIWRQPRFSWQWLFFSAVIDVTVSPLRFRKMSTSLARPSLGCCSFFPPLPSFVFAEYCKMAYQVVLQQKWQGFNT